MAQSSTPGAGHERYAFERGFPTDTTTQQAYDDADLDRAIQELME